MDWSIGGEIVAHPRAYMCVAVQRAKLGIRFSEFRKRRAQVGGAHSLFGTGDRVFELDDLCPACARYVGGAEISHEIGNLDRTDAEFGFIDLVESLERDRHERCMWKKQFERRASDPCRVKGMQIGRAHV